MALSESWARTPWRMWTELNSIADNIRCTFAHRAQLFIHLSNLRDTCICLIFTFVRPVPPSYQHQTFQVALRHQRHVYILPGRFSSSKLFPLFGSVWMIPFRSQVCMKWNNHTKTAWAARASSKCAEVWSYPISSATVEKCLMLHHSCSSWIILTPLLCFAATDVLTLKWYVTCI